MYGGHNAGQPECHEDTSPERPPFRFGELVPKADHDAGDSQGAHARQVDDLGLKVAVESVIQPRHKRAHYQQGYAAVIELGKQFAYEL